jgi:hypothetical protein
MGADRAQIGLEGECARALRFRPRHPGRVCRTRVVPGRTTWRSPVSHNASNLPADRLASLIEQSARGDEQAFAHTVLLACVNDHERGEVTVINGDAEITVTDHALARHIARIAGSGS